MTDQSLRLITQVVFVLVFVVALRDVVRQRDLARLEIAALFGTLAVIVVLQAVTRLIGVAPAWVEPVAALLVVAQPYLLLRLVEHFDHVPPRHHLLALLGLVGSWAILLAAGPVLPVWASVVVVLAFAAVEGYATVAFVRAARTMRGVVQRRLLAVAISSGLLAVVLVLAGVVAALPAANGVVAPLADLLALGSAVGYYLGFAPPAGLRRAWQMAEVQRFLVDLAGQSAEQRVVSALDYLGVAAARATGGTAGVVALAYPGSQHLQVHTAPENRAALAAAGITAFTLGATAPVLARAWHELRPIASGDPATWGPDLCRLAAACGNARGVLVAPLIASGRPYGLFIVLVQRGSLFVQDDLAVLTVLAEQAALAIESRRLIETTEQERATLAAVMASMNDGLLVIDATGQVRYCNAQAEAQLGIASGTLRGASAETAFASIRPSLADPEPAWVAWQQAVSMPAGRASFEVSAVTPLPRDVLIQPFPVAERAGAPPGTGLLLRDVSAERDLARTKDELVSVVSHELRTPLASLVGFAELLLTRDYAEPQRREFLTVMVREGRRLTALINDFLDLQRLENGAQQMVLAPTTLRPLVERAVAAVGEGPTTPIVVELPDDLPLVLADPDRIQQVLGNLLSNARKYSPAGGEIRVAAERNDGHLQVSVSDHGLGIPPEALPRLFEKFYRVDNSDRRTIKGTGLGLAIVRNMVEAHGGRIRVESPGLGQGSRFIFTLAVAPAPTTTAAALLPVISDSEVPAGGYVLVVEDDAAYGSWVCEALTGAGYTVRVAAIGEAAVQALTTTRPTALLLDLTLGGQLDGWEVLAVVRGRPDISDLPVIVVSASEEASRGRALGVTDYFVKPVEADVVLGAVGRLGVPRGRAVLVVEDDVVLCQALVAALQGADFGATGVGSGEEALSRLAAEPDAYGLLLDLGLPGIDGFAVLEEVRARPATRKLPVLVFTGRDLTSADKRCLAGRAVEVLRKRDGAGVPIVEAVSRVLSLPARAAGPG